MDHQGHAPFASAKASEDSRKRRQEEFAWRKGGGALQALQKGVPVLGSLLKEMQKDMDEKMDVLINTQKNNKP